MAHASRGEQPSAASWPTRWVLVKRCRRSRFSAAHQREWPPALVVCPTSLVTNWEEMKRGSLLPNSRRLVLEGADRAARFKSIADVDMVVTSYRTAATRHSTCLREIQISQPPCSTKAQAHQKPGDAKTRRARVRPPREASAIGCGPPMEKFGCAISWSIMNFALARLSLEIATTFREALRITDRAWLPRPTCNAGSRAGFSRFPASPKKNADVCERSAPKKSNRSVPCSLNESSTRRLRRATCARSSRVLGSSGKNVNAGAQRMKMLTGLLRFAPGSAAILRLVGIDKEETLGKAGPCSTNSSREAIDGEHTRVLRLQPVRLDAWHLIRER